MSDRTVVESALLEALREIAKGEGAFSRDQLTHAKNTITSMIEIANAAIALAEAPQEDFNLIQETIDALDEADDERKVIRYTRPGGGSQF